MSGIIKVGDKIYHHILDPKTGYPYKNNLLGVSIVCDSSTEADALSTTCFAMGLDDGLKYIEGIKGQRHSLSRMIMRFITPAVSKVKELNDVGCETNQKNKWYQIQL
ncbi:MAG: FAD:protein FMN transferase [Coprococcus sp.]